MTDFCQTVSMSFFSPLRFTPLSKSHWHFFIFGTHLFTSDNHRTTYGVIHISPLSG